MYKNLLEERNADGYLVFDHSDIRYFSGLTSSNIALLITKNESFVFSDSRYKYRIESQNEFTPIVVNKSVAAAAAEKAKELKLKKILAEPEDFSYGDYIKNLSSVKDALQFESGITTKIRAVKRKDEIEKIIKAQGIAEKALKEVFSFIKEGITTKEIAAKLDYIMGIMGSEEPAFSTIALTGAQTADCHGIPDGTKVKNGDFLLFDFGATVNGYRSDMTRTIAYGNVTEEMGNIYDIVLKAHLKAAKELKAEVKASEIDKKAREYIREEGYGELFLHSTGHGVGLDIHEYPTLSTKSDAVLSEGMAVTIEPGIYIKDKFGIRIEDTYIIEKNGSYSTAKMEKNLIKLK